MHKRNHATRHHRDAADHHQHAAVHHRKAAQHHESGDYAQSTYHAQIAHGHSLRANELANNASKHYMTQHGDVRMGGNPTSRLAYHGEEDYGGGGRHGGYENRYEKDADEKSSSRSGHGHMRKTRNHSGEVASSVSKRKPVTALTARGRGRQGGARSQA